MQARSMGRMLSVGCALSLVGCASQGPPRLAADRFDYNTAIADSWRTQNLLNVVRLRYSDWPVFLDVEQIVAQYTWEQTGSAKATVRTPFGGDNDQGELGWVGKMSERPAVLYKPIRGSRYMRSMLTPAEIGALLGLIHTGWPADRTLEIFLHSAQGHRNLQIEAGQQLRPDPVFAHFLRTLRAFQLQDALVVRVQQKLTAEDAPTQRPRTQLGFRPDRVDEATRGLLTSLQDSLGLSKETTVYDVAWGAVSNNDTTLALETRSTLQLMVVLSGYVEVDPKDVEEGRAQRLNPVPTKDTSKLGPLMNVRSGDKAPVDAFAQCRYRGQAFWIDDTDVNSKTTFSYLMLLLTMGDVDERSGAQLVITTN